MEIDREALLQTFLAESEENLSVMEEALVALERRPEDEEILRTIFRVAHTLKGSASSLGFQGVTEFAHSVEDLLQRLRDRTLPVTSGLITLLLRTVDALRQMVPDAVAGIEETQPAHAALMKRLAEKVPTATEEEAAGFAVPARRKRPFGRRQQDIQGWMDRAQTLRVGIDKLDRLLNLTGEIAIAQGRVRQLLEERVGRVGEEILETQWAVDRLWIELQEQIMKVRMVPVGPTFRQHIRTVRDIALTHGKVARLVIEGEDVEVDTTVVEHLKDPLTHMIRNALDHGIEPPEVRTAAGKDPCGCVTLRACHDAGSIVIEVADDGGGLKREEILKRAAAQGLIPNPQHVEDSGVYRLIFEPGFSTAETVTELSGRGIGLDVVRRNIDTLRGSVAIDSREGEGTTITIRLPLTLAIIQGFAVGVGGETFILPLDAVIECLELPEEERRHTGHGVVNLRGEVLPYLRLRELLTLDGVAPPRESIIVAHHKTEQVGLVVDILYGESQAVIKPLGKVFAGLPGVSGSTILGNGRVALILDVPGLITLAHKRELQAVA